MADVPRVSNSSLGIAEIEEEDSLDRVLRFVIRRRAERIVGKVKAMVEHKPTPATGVEEEASVAKRKP